MPAAPLELDEVVVGAVRRRSPRPRAKKAKKVPALGVIRLRKLASDTGGPGFSNARDKCTRSGRLLLLLVRGSTKVSRHHSEYPVDPVQPALLCSGLCQAAGSKAARAPMGLIATIVGATNGVGVFMYTRALRKQPLFSRAPPPGPAWAFLCRCCCARPAVPSLSPCTPPLRTRARP